MAPRFLSAIIFYLLSFPYLLHAAGIGGFRPFEVPVEEPPPTVVIPRPGISDEDGFPPSSSSSSDDDPYIITDPFIAPDNVFSEPVSGSNERPDLLELADKITELTQQILDALQQNASPDSSSTTDSAVPNPTQQQQSSSDDLTPDIYATTTTTDTPIPSTSPTTTDYIVLNVTLACEIYQSYTSLCPPITTASPATRFGVYPPPPSQTTSTLDEAAAQASNDQARATCLCYSSTYYVPDAYDEAAWACGYYMSPFTSLTSSPTSPTVAEDQQQQISSFAAAATAAGETYGFCASVGNVIPGAPSARFGEYAVTAAVATQTAGTGSAGQSAAAPVISSSSSSSLGRGGEISGFEGLVVVVVVATGLVVYIM